jgi:hypothetical protein
MRAPRTGDLGPSSADTVRVGANVEELSSPITALEQVDTKPTTQQITSDNPSSSQTYMRSMPVYGRIVVDYSCGLVITTLRNNNWFIDTNANIQYGPKDPTNLAISGLVHLYKTSPSFIIPALSLGIALGDNNRFLFGASAVIKLNISRVVLTCGGAFGKVTLLNNNHKVGDTTTLSTVPTVTVQKFGGFFGLSYSISI